MAASLFLVGAINNLVAPLSPSTNMCHGNSFNFISKILGRWFFRTAGLEGALPNIEFEIKMQFLISSKVDIK